MDDSYQVDISVVIPVYNEVRGLDALVARLEENFQELRPLSFEVVFVNDGSQDGSLQKLKEICMQNRQSAFFFVDLARNFGKEIALSAGLDYARGRAIITMDSDLQHPPEYLGDLIRPWVEEGAEVVTTIRESTEKKSATRSIASKIFYKAITMASDVQMVASTTDFRLMDRKVVDYFCKVGERQRMFRGIVDWLGFKTRYIKFKAAEREFGEPTYSYYKLFGLAIDSFVSFSSWPLRVISLLGLLIFMGSSLLLGWMLLARTISAEFYYTPLAMFVVGNTMLTGIILLALGLVSLYVGKIYGEVIQRPLYTVREQNITRFQDAGTATVAEMAPEAARFVGTAVPAFSGSESQN